MKRFNTYDSYQILYDGRRFDQIRNINFKFGVYPHADGSVYYEQGCKKVICAVYGPRQNEFEHQMIYALLIVNFHYQVLQHKIKKKLNVHINQMERMIEAGFDANEKIYACLHEAILLRTEEIRKIVAVKEIYVIVIFFHFVDFFIINLFIRNSDY